MEPAHKKLRECKQVVVKYDRFSDLPDSIIHHIFSFLPNDYIPCISILSRRLKDLCKSSPYLYFQFNVKSIEDKDIKCKRFVRYLDEFLKSCNRLTIHRFRLYFLQKSYYIDDYRLWNLIWNVFRCNVQEIDIRLQGENLTLLGYNYASLKVLSLHGASLVPEKSLGKEISKRYTSLRRLHLRDIRGKELNLSMTSSSLEVLTIHQCCLSGVQSINCSSLRKLTIFECTITCRDISISAKRLETFSIVESLRSNGNNYFRIYAPNLKSIVWINASLGYRYLKSFLSLQEATIRSPEYFWKISACELLRSVSYTRTLQLDICAIEAMFIGNSIAFSSFSWDKLHHLRVMLSNPKTYQVEALISCLSQTTNLRLLTVKYDTEALAYRTKSRVDLLRSKENEFRAWRKKSENVMLGCHLEEVKIEFGQTGTGIAKRLKSYLVKHAKGLKKMTLT